LKRLRNLQNQRGCERGYANRKRMKKNLQTGKVREANSAQGNKKKKKKERTRVTDGRMNVGKVAVSLLKEVRTPANVRVQWHDDKGAAKGGTEKKKKKGGERRRMPGKGALLPRGKRLEQ